MTHLGHDLVFFCPGLPSGPTRLRWVLRPAVEPPLVVIPPAAAASSAAAIPTIPVLVPTPIIVITAPLAVIAVPTATAAMQSHWKSEHEDQTIRAITVPAAPIKKHHLPVVAPAIPTTVAASTASVRHGCRCADNLVMTSSQRTVTYTAEDGDGRGGVNAALQARFKPSWTTNEGFLCLSYLPPSCYLTPKPPGAPEEDTLSPSSRQTCNSQFLAFHLHEWAW